MHEALIARSKVVGSEDPDGIMIRFNCVLPCTECHSRILGVGGDEYFEKSARYLVERDGFISVRTWLLSVRDKYVAGPEALRRFDNIDWR
jgi:hypothetical protein